MLKSAFALSVAAAALLVAMPASATALVADTGWHVDTLETVDDPTDGSPWTFTVSGTAMLSVVDCCAPGDTFTLSGDVSGVTSFYSGQLTDVQYQGDFAYFWYDDAFSKLALTVGPGTYSFSITGDGSGGVPASLGVRLDTLTAGAVPEPMSWALMIGGFAMTGAAMRRRRPAVSFA